MVTQASASASHPQLSAPGCASVTCLVVLANARFVPSSKKTIIVDTQLYLGPGDQDFLIGSLSYFNSANLVFNDKPSLYTIHATFARRDSTADVPVSGQRALLDYSFVGDIHLLSPLGPPGLRYLPLDSPSEDDEGRVDLNVLETFTIDPCVRPYIHVTGVAVECSKAEATFEINVQQYVSCVKSDPSTKQAGGSRLKPTTRFFCHIPDSPKYRSWGGKPVPGNNRYVSISGFLTGANRSDNNEIEQFLIEVEHITFCGQYTPPANSAEFVSQNSSPGKSSALFSYKQPPQSPSQPRKRKNQGGA